MGLRRFGRGDRMKRVDALLFEWSFAWSQRLGGPIWVVLGFLEDLVDVKGEDVVVLDGVRQDW